MPYQTIEELPKPVKSNLPEHAQKIYQESFNHAWEEYNDKQKQKDPDKSREETAHRVAWSAVKQKYEKNEHDKWEKKE